MDNYPGQALCYVYVCTGCHHQADFHRAAGKEKPCYLCSPAECMVKGCSCARYEGPGFNTLPHEYHVATQTPWGAWGIVTFTPTRESLRSNRTISPAVSETG